MSMVYEDENKIVCVKLSKNDYIKVISMDDENDTLKVRNEDGKLIVEEQEQKEVIRSKKTSKK